MVKIMTKKENLKEAGKKKESKKEQAKIIEEIWKNAGEWFDYYSENIENHRKDFDFCYAEDGQWTAAEIKEANELRKFGKVRLTFNMMIKIINTLVGEYSETDPEVKVRNTDTAEINQQLTQKINILTGLLRNISRKSRFDEVKAVAFESAIEGGFGAFGLTVKEEKLAGFNLVPRYIEINDPTTCFWDRTAQLKDKSDGWFCGRCYIWKKEAVKKKYGVEIGNVTSSISKIDAFSWLTDEDTIIADYWKKIQFKRHIALLSNDKVVDFDEAQKIVADSKKSAIVDDIEILEEKEIDDFKIKFYRVANEEMLETREWSGTILPIIFQAGVIKRYRGREYTYSLIRFLKDAQRTYNLSRSETWFWIKKMRTEPYIGPDECTEGYEEEWKTAHLPRAYLPCKESKSGRIPEKQIAAQPPQALTIETQQSAADLQQIMGRFEANEGAPSNEKSGLAIMRRQRAGNLSVKPFFDNAESALQSGNVGMLDLISKIFDNRRLVQITDENGATKNVRINEDDSTNLTDGGFEVEVTLGPNFETQKAEAVQLLLEAYRANPGYAKISSDIFAKNLDIKDASLLADRARTYLQPQITQDEGENLSQEQIIANNQKEKQQGQAIQQQLLIQNMQLDQMVKKTKAQDDIIKALASQMGGMADIMNAQTNRAEAQAKGVLEMQKLQAEEDRALRAEQTARLKLAQEEVKELGRQPNQLFG